MATEIEGDMNYERDLIDDLTDYTTKMRQEYFSVDDVLDHAIEHAAKIRVARKLISEAEHGRLQFSNALRPFLPEPAPVVLQSDPAPQFNGHYADPFGDDLPSFIGREGE